MFLNIYSVNDILTTGYRKKLRMLFRVKTKGIFLTLARSPVKLIKEIVLR